MKLWDRCGSAIVVVVVVDIYLDVFDSQSCLVLDLRLKSVNGRGFGPPLEVGVAGSALAWLYWPVLTFDVGCLQHSTFPLPRCSQGACIQSAGHPPGALVCG